MIFTDDAAMHRILEEIFSLQNKFSNSKGDWWHLVKEKGSPLLWLDNNFTTLTTSATTAARPLILAAAASDLAGVGRTVGVIWKEHGCTLSLNRHCVQVNVHLERNPQLSLSQS